MKEDNKRMIKNTMSMYIRMVVIVLIQLYTVPLVLDALGAEDYGIYQVVGGFVAIFAFVQASLTSGCQRFYAYAIGKNDKETLVTIFNVTQTIYIVLSLLCFVIIEGVGVWFLNYHMVIPATRLFAANCVFQFSLVSFVMSLFMTPYHSALIAHEHISVYAYVSIVEVIFKLIIVFVLLSYTNDKLILYSFLSLILTLFLSFFYIFYNLFHFEETRKLRLKWDRKLVYDIGSYAGWNILGAISNILRTQGLNVVMNLFFGPLLNAAHALASTINGFLNQILGNVYMVTRPQMTKKFAQERTEEMWNIVFRSTKFTFFLLCFLAIPLIIEIDYVLSLWLGNYPQYTSSIAVLMIITCIIESFSNQIIGAFQAKNMVKYCQIVPNVITIITIPLAYCLLSFSKFPLLPYIVAIIISTLYTTSILFLAKKHIGLELREYLVNVIYRSMAPFFISFAITLFIVFHLNDGLTKFLIVCITSICSNMFFIWFVGMEVSERKYVRDIINVMLMQRKL